MGGLQYLETKGYVHRDLKPENIMIQEDMPSKVISVYFKICDFGLSTKIGDSNLLYRRCGTPGYVSPEIVMVDADSPHFTVSPKADIFSAGVIMYLLISTRVLTKPVKLLLHTRLLKKLFEGQQSVGSTMVTNRYLRKIQKVGLQ